ncbi:MAG TPA: polysaccharide deacetylase family protein [Gaiellaceae bacterium]|nr:polysaccharide deacetylase family protein [Gaiellaceae bacterium]
MPLPSRRLTVPILMYHRIGRLPRVGDRYPGLTVQSRVFAEQMEWLARHGFHAVSERQLFDALEWGRPALPSRPVVITFDDGYRDVLWNAEPILHRLHMPATVFVITDRISGRDSSFLTWKNLTDLERDGFAIGSHSVNHRDLTTLSPMRVWLELTRSRGALQRHLGVPGYWFSYPAGVENPAVVRLVRRAGYLLAVTTRPGFSQSAREPFLLHRDEIGRSDGLAGFTALLRSA